MERNSVDIEKLQAGLPTLMQLALDQVEAIMTDPDADADGKIKAFIELKKIIKETTGTVTGTHVDTVANFVEWNPAYLGTIVGKVMEALEFGDWQPRDLELAKRVVRGWCKGQAEMAGKVIEAGLRGQAEVEVEDDGWPWDLADEGRPADA